MQEGNFSQTSPSATGVQSSADTSSQRFTDLLISEELVDKLKANGYSRPTVLQAQAIPAILNGKNVCLVCEKGAGKTVAYAVPLTQRANTTSSRTLVVSDVAARIQEISDAFKSLAAQTVTLSAQSGVKDSATLVMSLSEAALHAITEEVISLANFDTLVLDQVDCSASTLISDNVEAILAKFLEQSPKKQVIIVARTRSIGISSLISKFFNGAIEELSGSESGGSSIEHIYYELGNDLLAKPNALCDILQALGRPSTAIFCNSPSDADLVDAILKKAGIPSRKLIGNVPQNVATDAIRQCARGEITALVVTDVSARVMDVDELETIVNYSIHNDPETYLHRMGRAEGRLKRVISLVNAIDFSNFHYVRKIVDFDFTKAELPSPMQIGAARFDALKAEAIKNNKSEDSTIKDYTARIAESAERDQIIAHLLYNTLYVLPELKDQAAMAQSSGGRRESFGSEGGRFEGEGRGGRSRGGRRDRRGRDDYRDDQGGGEGFEPRGYDEEGSGRGHYGQQRGGRDDQQFAGERGEGEQQFGRGERRRRDDRRDDGPPPERDVRFYVGHGAKQSFSEASLTDLLQKAELNPAEVVKRFSQRDNYSFVDVPEAKADEILGKLETLEISSGNPFFVRKATVISAPRPERSEGDFAENSGADQQLDGGSDNPGDVQDFEQSDAREERQEDDGYSN